MYQTIWNKAKDKNPIANDGTTPIHLAAQNGHLAVFHLIGEGIDNINPKDLKGVTPLHGGVLDPPGLWCQTDLPLIRNTVGVGRPVLLWSRTFQRLPTGLLLGEIYD